MDDRTRGRAVPVLAAAAVLAVLAAVLVDRTGADPAPARPEAEPTPAASRPAEPAADEPAPIEVADVPVSVGQDLYVGGEQVPGRWYHAEGRASRWIALRDDRTWWWGYDATPQLLEGEMEQPPVISPSGDYLARVVRDGGGRMLIGSDTQWGGEGFGGVDLPGIGKGAPPRALAVTDDGLVVAGGAKFQWLWRPLVDGDVIDLAETAPGQVVLGGTGAGLVVVEGERDDLPDATTGEPYLARLSPEGALTRLVPLPTHDVLEAGEEWMAYVPPGTIGGEASSAAELEVQRLDGSASGALTPPEGWLFVAPGFRWETRDRLLALVVTRDGGDEGLVRCRPDELECVLVDLP